MLYASNFRHGTVDVFNDQWQQVMSLTDGSLPAGYAPFNAQVLDGHLFVTYAQQDQFKHDDVAGQGNGFVDEFDLNGQLVTASHPTGRSIRPGGSRSRRRISASIVAICSWETSATEQSVPSTYSTTMQTWASCWGLTDFRSRSGTSGR